MLGFQNKTSAKERWHPDFRMVEKLPDTKIVRTKFLVNFSCILICAALVVVVGYREFSKLGIRNTIASYQQEKDSRQKSNRKHMVNSRDFRNIQTKAKEILKFKNQPIEPSRAFVNFARMRTEDVVFDEIGYINKWDSDSKKEVFDYTISGQGRTTADIAELKNRLSILEVDEEYSVSVSEVGNPTKDTETGIFAFKILVSISKDKDGTE